MIYTTIIEEIDGEMLLTIPKELIKEMNWDENTELEIKIIDNQLILSEVKSSG